MKINKKEIEKEVNSLILSDKKKYTYLLTEILINSDKTKNIKEKHKLIKQSISEVGFKNTANIYSISNTAKLGGKIGWVNENQLSKIIKKNIQNLNVGEYTNLITIPGGLLILNIDEKKIIKEKLDYNEELKKRIIYEKNKQLDQFSKIYFSKIKKNSVISE